VHSRRCLSVFAHQIKITRTNGADPQAADAVDYAKFFSRSHDAVIRVYDEAGNVIETHEHKGDLKEP